MGNVFKIEILCVTKKPARSSMVAKWHLGITGIAEIGATVSDMPINSKSKVIFDGNIGDLLYIRSGLSGSAVVFGVSMSDGYVWELYSTIPTPKHSEAEIRRNAGSAIEESIESALI